MRDSIINVIISNLNMEKHVYIQISEITKFIYN